MKQNEIKKSLLGKYLTEKIDGEVNMAGTVADVVIKSGAVFLTIQDVSIPIVLKLAQAEELTSTGLLEYTSALDKDVIIAVSDLKKTNKKKK